MTASALDAGFAGLRERLIAEVDARLLRAAGNGLTPKDLGSVEELSARADRSAMGVKPGHAE